MARNVKIVNSKKNVKGNTQKRSDKKKKKPLNFKKKPRIERSYDASVAAKALEALRAGKSFRAVEEEYNIPLASLHRLSKDERLLHVKKGASTVLTQDEETDIANWIIYSAERGFPITKQQLLDTIRKYVTEHPRPNKFKNNRPGKKWMKAFMKRHPNIAFRTAQNLTTTRAGVQESDVRTWFSKLKEFLVKEKLYDPEEGEYTISARSIFNLDETAIYLVPKNDCYVLAEKGAKVVKQVCTGNEKGNVTISFCANAAGEIAPPMILFNGKRSPRQEVLKKVPRHWGIGNTEKGWMDLVSFYLYVVKVFYPWLLANGIQFPVILYVDGHSSHFSKPLAEFCKAKRVEIIQLFPNATHFLQPLDTSFFAALKQHYRQELREWRYDNEVTNVEKSDIPELIQKTLDLHKESFVEGLKNGFRVCGLYPLNPDEVNYNPFNKKKECNEVAQVSSKGVLIPSGDQDISASLNANEKLLEIFETKLVDPDTLEVFKSHNPQNAWSGSEKLIELYMSWRKLKDLCEDKQSYGTSPNDDGNTNENASSIDPVDANPIEVHTGDQLPRSDEIVELDLDDPENFIIGDCTLFGTPLENDLKVAAESVGHADLPYGEIDLSAFDENARSSFDAHDFISASSSSRSKSDKMSYSHKHHNIDDELESFDAPDYAFTGSSCMSMNEAFNSFDLNKEGDEILITEVDNEIIDLSQNAKIKEDSSLQKCTVAVLGGNGNSTNDLKSSESTTLVNEAESILSESEKFNYEVQRENRLDVSSKTNSRTRDKDLSTAPETLALEHQMRTMADNGSVIPGNTSQNQDHKNIQFLSEFGQVAKLPKSYKKKTKNNTVEVNTIDHLLSKLQKKEEQQKLKEMEALERKSLKEQNKLRREKEMDLLRSFREKKTALVQKKKSLADQIKDLKRKLKVEKNKDDIACLEIELCDFSAQIEKIEQELLVIQRDSIVSRIKIKQEKLE